MSFKGFEGEDFHCPSSVQLNYNTQPGWRKCEVPQYMPSV